MSNFQPSKYQKAIFQWHTQNGIRNGNMDALVVQAVAGSGKTSSIVHAMSNHLPQSMNACAVAFNTAIADSLRVKLPGRVVKTYHALGRAALVNAFGNVVVDGRKCEVILRNHLDRSFWGHLYPAILKLVGLVKNNLLFDQDNTTLMELAIYHSLDLGDDADVVFDAVRYVFNKSLSLTNTIDFDDMISMPIFLNLQSIPQYDYLAVDECLPYKTPVLLADGSSKLIGDIVEQQQSVSVLSYNTETGEQVPCNVIGWHKILNQKPLVKVRVRLKKRRSKTSAAYNFVVCTVDHKVWTDDGYVNAGDLQPGMVVQVETSAERSEHYKITKKGRATLSSIMDEKNRSGKMNTNPTPKGTVIVNRGGNGSGLTEPQKTLLAALGGDWKSEIAIPLRPTFTRSTGYPTAYKVDLANPVEKIAVEVDGYSHNYRKEQDKKKDDCLQRLGWKVYRVSNQRVMQELSNVVSEIQSLVTDCPVDAVVVSVDAVTIKDWHVYDISVENCHNFYANGILVHNCQDTNAAQMELVSRSIRSNGVIVAIGDVRQSIYGFRGADVDAMPKFAARFNADRLPLSITYRNPLEVVKLVNTKFPDIEFEAWDKAIQGEVIEMSFNKIQFQPGDMILCRMNAPLVGPCFSLIRRGIKAIIKGKDIGNGLASIIKKFQRQSTDLADCLARLNQYRQDEMYKLMQAERTMQAQMLDDKIETIFALADGCMTIADVLNRIDTVFSDDTTQPIVFSSIHKAKGLEAKNVYIIKPELLPFKCRNQQPWQEVQERNVQYVAYTRAIERLVLVTSSGDSADSDYQFIRQ